MRTILATLIALTGGIAQAQTTTAVVSRAAQSQPTEPCLRLMQTIPLPDVKGRLDHMAIDLKDQQLFLAALGNNTLEVLDLSAGKRTKSIPGFFGPQGVAYLPEQDVLVVTYGGTGLVQFLQREPFKEVRRHKFQDDADNIRYEPAIERIFVGYGDALACFDAPKRQWLMDFSMGGHPEGFQAETRGKRVFINVPDYPQGPMIKVLLRRDPRDWAHLDDWPLTYGKGNYPMAMDEQNHRLFVGCREPAMLQVLDTESGKVVDYTPIGGDSDDIFYDASARRLYISCGAGELDVLRQIDLNHYKLIERVPTTPGARTCLFVPQTRRLYLAVPYRDKQPAEVRVYETDNGRQLEAGGRGP
jgi:DNA-binding beta-propeller fold protein YncE